MNNTEPKSVREYIKEIQSEILKIEDLSPDRASITRAIIEFIWYNSRRNKKDRGIISKCVAAKFGE